MITYRGFNLLQTRMDSSEPINDTFKRKTFSFDPGPSRRSKTTKDNAPKVVHPYTWTCLSQSQIAELKAFINTMCGRWKAIWVPTWRQDLITDVSLSPTETQLSIQNVGYSAFAFTHKARRNIQIQVGSNFYYRRILNAVENGDSETIYLDSAVGVTVPAGSIISYLLFCRLNDDSIMLTYPAINRAQCIFEFIECPEEVP